MDNLTHKVVQLEGTVNNMNEDLTAIEVVTSKNWNDIAKIKSVRQTV